MTYLQFHLVFVLPPILGLALLQRRPVARLGARAALGWLAAVTAIAFVYTTPWDNYLLYRGVWRYGADRVMGTIGYVPIEEYAFFLLQPVLTGLFYFALRSRGSNAPALSEPRGFRLGWLGFWVAITVAGALLLLGPPRGLYLGLILAWAGPALAGMTWVGAHKVWGDRRRVALAIAAPTLYLWVADRIAIGLGIWDIAPRYSLPLRPLGLPIEEAVFFLLTNVLCVWGLALFLPAPTPARA